MRYLTIEEMRTQCGRESDDSTRDAEISEYTAAAEDFIETQLGRTYSEVLEGGELPRPLKQAVKLLAAYYFSNREAVSDKNLSAIPYGVRALIWNYRAL